MSNQQILFKRAASCYYQTSNNIVFMINVHGGDLRNICQKHLFSSRRIFSACNEMCLLTIGSNDSLRTVHPFMDIEDISSHFMQTLLAGKTISRL